MYDFKSCIFAIEFDKQDCKGKYKGFYVKLDIKICLKQKKESQK
jgi:hypothetical protein